MTPLQQRANDADFYRYAGYPDKTKGKMLQYEIAA